MMVAWRWRFYGMSTFEGPLMSIKAVNSTQPLYRLDHRPRPFRRTGLGRDDFTFGALYYLAPKLWGRQRLYSLRSWSTVHFWLATLGIVIYALGDVGLRHHAGPDVARIRMSSGLPGQYSLRETVEAMHPYYMIAGVFGGLLYLAGALVMAYNIVPDDHDNYADG